MTDVQHQWIMQCCDGCVLTFYDTEEGAILAFSGHLKIGHRAILLEASGIVDPKQFEHSVIVRASKESAK